MLRSIALRASVLALSVSLSAMVQAARPASPDHHEFEAALHVPYAEAKSAAREFTLYFSWVDARDPSTVAWKLELLDAQGKVQRLWHGEERLYQKQIETAVAFDGRGADGRALAAGFYRVRLSATAGDPTVHRSRAKALAQRVDAALGEDLDDVHVQEWDLRIGAMPKLALPAFTALPTANVDKAQAATASFPYTVYFGNLHGQSNDSDGGGAIGSCTSSQAAQSGAYGPADAFTYARGRSLDFLLESEHNHYFDGSSSTNTAASPSTAINRYAAGRNAAAASNSANPSFLALYGMEWGVISGGGHLNIINANQLAAWEYNSSNQLLGDVYVAKNDYATLYTTMKSRGWVGQFNHPSTSDQFKINGVVMGYSADGDDVMVGAEIMNTSAFSSNTTETETSRSTYESAFNQLLENGFHVAPTTNQDNHCANWGASYTNRTGVLLPTGTALTEANFVEALRARRVFATMDKNSQLIVSANGRIMGSRFNNSGSLALVAHFANSNGRSVSQVQWYEGVPRRGGTVSLLASTATHTFTPANGEHFYYAKLTQDDGKILWSAPVWVSQGGTGDTTPPSVSASVAGTSGTITLSATASDNVGVSSVEFLVDGVSKGSDSSSPYSMTLNSTTLANGSHSLTARAVDAAGNSTTSTAVSFSINNPVPDTTPPTVSASASATGTSGTITLSATASDNVGVSSVEFRVDGVLKGSDSSSPYSMSLDSTTLTNGSHSLTARAVDAAGNATTSTAVNFSVSNTTNVEQVKNGGFESGSSNWTATSGVITNDASFAAYQGSWKAWMNGYGSSHTDSVYQSITIPSTATSATLSFWLDVATDETTTTSAYDTLKVQVRNSSNSVLATLATYSNLNAAGGYSQKSFNLLAYKGQTIRVYFLGVEGSQVATSFVLDNVSVITR